LLYSVYDFMWHVKYNIAHVIVLTKFTYAGDIIAVVSSTVRCVHPANLPRPTQTTGRLNMDYIILYILSQKRIISRSTDCCHFHASPADNSYYWAASKFNIILLIIMNIIRKCSYVVLGKRRLARCGNFGLATIRAVSRYGRKVIIFFWYRIYIYIMRLNISGCGIDITG